PDAASMSRITPTFSAESRRRRWHLLSWRTPTHRALAPRGRSGSGSSRSASGGRFRGARTERAGPRAPDPPCAARRVSSDRSRRPSTKELLDRVANAGQTRCDLINRCGELDEGLRDHPVRVEVALVRADDMRERLLDRAVRSRCGELEL